MSQERMLLEQLFFFFKVNSLNCSHFTMLSSRDSIKNKANACKCQCLQEQSSHLKSCSVCCPVNTLILAFCSCF